jgi:hypothetical protein
MIAAGMQKARLRLAAGPFGLYFYCTWLGEIVGQERSAISHQGLAISGLSQAIGSGWRRGAREIRWRGTANTDLTGDSGSPYRFRPGLPLHV